MENEPQHFEISSNRRLPWNKGKLIGAKWSIRMEWTSIRGHLAAAERPHTRA